MSLFVVVGCISECRSIFYRYTEYLRWTDVRSFNACPQTAVHSLLFVAKVVTCFFRNFNSNVDYKQNASNLLYSRSSMLFSNKCALKLFWLWLFVCHPNLQDYCYHCSPSEFIWIGLWKTEKERTFAIYKPLRKYFVVSWWHWKIVTRYQFDSSQGLLLLSIPHFSSFISWLIKATKKSPNT